MTFKSKISWGLFLPILIIMFTAGIFAIYEHEYSVAIILLVSILLILLLLFNTSYEVTNYKVLITSAFIIKESMLIQDIIRITENRNILSAPAASFDRIYLETKSGKKNISPEKKEIFIHLLQEINENIEVIRLTQ
jgi:uncharacterized membrane protein